MEAVIVLIILVYAFKHAAEDTKRHWRTSKAAYMRSADKRFPQMPRSRRAAYAARHDVGYWAGQAFHGFPSSRHGLAAGWHAGRKAQAEGVIAREQAKTEHLEARVRLGEQVAEFRARQKAALEKLRTAVRTVPGNDADGRCLGCGAPDGEACAPDCRTRGVTFTPREGRATAGEGSPATPASGTRREDGYTGSAAPNGYIHIPAEALTGLTPAQVSDIKRKVCEAHEADGVEPDEVIVGEDGTVTIDRRARYPWAKPITWKLSDGSPVGPRVCVACGNPEYGPRKGGGDWGPLVTYTEPIYGDGYPEAPRLIHKAHFEDESSGFYGRPYEDAGDPHARCDKPGCGCPCHADTEAPAVIAGEVLQAQPEIFAITQGETVMAAATAGDVTYNNQMSELVKMRNESDQELAQAKAKLALASVSVDSLIGMRAGAATIGHAEARLAAHKRQVEAAQQALDEADAAIASLKHEHGDFQEAADNVGHLPAEPEFYGN